jgi:tRNA-2-methylthio-N6-dimethylallyladenosine synthase
VREVEELVRCGVKDVTLLGQNVNEYLRDGVDFARLLETTARTENLFRLRFLTSHPKDFIPGILDVVYRNKNICEWFHLPLQSGNDRILQLMNRRYTKEHYLNLILEIRRMMPEAAVTTDVIAGFPTETEDEFQETLDIMRAVRFDDAYMYRYSPRKGTAAAEYEPLPESVVKGRLQRMIDLQGKVTEDKTLAMFGKHYEVLFESPAENGTRGKTRGNKDVIVERSINPGEVRNVLITEIRGRTPVGKIVKNGE